MRLRSGLRLWSSTVVRARCPIGYAIDATPFRPRRRPGRGTGLRARPPRRRAIHPVGPPRRLEPRSDRVIVLPTPPSEYEKKTNVLLYYY